MDRGVLGPVSVAGTGHWKVLWWPKHLGECWLSSIQGREGRVGVAGVVVAEEEQEDCGAGGGGQVNWIPPFNLLCLGGGSGVVGELFDDGIPVSFQCSKRAFLAMDRIADSS